MSLQDRKAKDRISQDPESRDVSKEVKGKRMTYKSPVPRRLNGSNRASTEPKIMLKKIRSIKLYKLYGLKRRGTSQLDWKSTDSSSNDFSDGKKYIEASPCIFTSTIYYIGRLKPKSLSTTSISKE